MYLCQQKKKTETIVKVFKPLFSFQKTLGDCNKMVETNFTQLQKTIYSRRFCVLWKTEGFDFLKLANKCGNVQGAACCHQLLSLHSSYSKYRKTSLFWNERRRQVQEDVRMRKARHFLHFYSDNGSNICDRVVTARGTASLWGGMGTTRSSFMIWRTPDGERREEGWTTPKISICSPKILNSCLRPARPLARFRSLWNKHSLRVS